MGIEVYTVCTYMEFLVSMFFGRIREDSLGNVRLIDLIDSNRVFGSVRFGSVVIRARARFASCVRTYVARTMMQRQAFETATQRRRREEGARKLRIWNRAKGPGLKCPLGLNCVALRHACGNLCRTCAEWYIEEMDDDAETPVSGYRVKKFHWEALVFALRSAAPLVRRGESGCATREEDAKEKRVTPFLRWMFDEAVKLKFTWHEVTDERVKHGIRNLLIKAGVVEFCRRANTLMGRREGLGYYAYAGRTERFFKVSDYESCAALGTTLEVYRFLRTELELGFGEKVTFDIGCHYYRSPQHMREILGFICSNSSGAGDRLWHPSTMLNVVVKDGCDEMSIEQLNILREYGCPLNLDLCAHCCDEERYELLYWSIENGFPHDHRVVNKAAGQGRIDVIKRLQEMGIQPVAGACARAAKGGQLKTLQYLYEHRVPMGVATIRAAAAPVVGQRKRRREKLDYIEWEEQPRIRCLAFALAHGCRGAEAVLRSNSLHEYTKSYLKMFIDEPAICIWFHRLPSIITKQMLTIMPERTRLAFECITRYLRLKHLECAGVRTDAFEKEELERLAF